MRMRPIGPVRRHIPWLMTPFRLDRAVVRSPEVECEFGGVRGLHMEMGKVSDKFGKPPTKMVSGGTQHRTSRPGRALIRYDDALSNGIGSGALSDEIPWC